MQAVRNTAIAEFVSQVQDVSVIDATQLPVQNAKNTQWEVSYTAELKNSSANHSCSCQKDLNVWVYFRTQRYCRIVLDITNKQEK